MTPQESRLKDSRSRSRAATKSWHVCVWVLLYLLISLWFPLSEALKPLGPGSTLAVTPPSPRKITFRDVTVETGITPKLTCGSLEKQYILEVIGSGLAWFDYNNDGYTDLYIVNGSTIEALLQSSGEKKQRNFLFRSNGNGTFTDVTGEAHVEGRGWGQGVL